MSLILNHKKEKRYVHSLIQNVADVPGGVTISSADLIPGTVINEGEYVSKPDNAGLCHIIKTAKVYENAASTAKAYKVAKGSQFKVGDIITTGAGAAAYAITAITTSEAAYDTITVGTTLGAATKDAYLVQATAASADASALRNVLGRLVEGYDVVANDNIFAPVVVNGTYYESLVPVQADLDAKLPAIVLL